MPMSRQKMSNWFIAQIEARQHKSKGVYQLSENLSTHENLFSGLFFWSFSSSSNSKNKKDCPNNTLAG